MYVQGRGHQHFGPGTSMTLFHQPNQFYGLGLFDSGMDLSSWGIGEWAIVGIGLFALFSMFQTGKRGVGSVRKAVGRRRSRARRKKELREELSRL